MKPALFAVILYLTSVQAQTSETSIFSYQNSYPVVWWAVTAADRPELANNAKILRQSTADPKLFAKNVITSIAVGKRNEVR